MNILKTALAWLSSFILVVTLFILLLICNVSSFFTIDKMQTNIDNIDISHEINKIQNSSATSENKAEIADIIDTAYSEAEDHGISSELVDEIFNSSEIKNFLGKALGTTTDYIINGKETEAVTSEEFNQILDNNIDTWIKNSGLEISDSKKEVLLIRMKSASAGIIDNLPNSKTVSSKLNQDTVKSIQFLFSNQVKMALIVISLISLFIIIITKRKQNKWLLYATITSGFTGLMTIATSFIIVDIITAALTKYNLTFLVNTISNNLANNIFITGIVTVVIAVIPFVIYFILNKKRNS